MQPSLPEVFRRAFALEGQGHHREASRLLESILAAQPGHTGALEALGRLCIGAGDFAGAEAWMLQAMAAGSRSPGLKAQLGSALLAQGKAEAALPLFEESLSAAPRGEVHVQACAASRVLGKFEDAKRHLAAALRLAPGSTEVLVEEAGLMRDLGQRDEAFAALEAAHFRHPRDPAVLDRYAKALLSRGLWRKGWELFEGRKEHPAHPLHAGPSQPPVWDGGLTPGLRLLVLAEQGMGEVLQFLRFLPPLAAQGLHVHLEIPPHQRSLEPLLKAQDHGVVYGFDGHVPPPIHATEALLSLPYRLSLEPGQLSGEPYLRAEAGRREAWAQRLGPKASKLRVGLLWAGNPKDPFDARRSLPPEFLAPLLALEHVHWVSLQKDLGRFGRSPTLPEGRWLEAGSGLADFGESAALLSNLDALVGVETDETHLAGALGVPTFLLLSHQGGWRWLEGREDSPWYRGHRILRQDSPGAWPGVVTRAAAELDRMASSVG